ncbi:hypothetical protein [Teichococcus rhizosphaerae]|uniref:hypothetical protein n=1 Tax=Teichococcus rhizosphaerae TaxID=1335062 RepID=UPI001FE59DF0|nr:hypothetical protein [Pseudoroseomonas rhizosphaerae]
MTDTTPSRSFRVRAYGDSIRDAGRTFRLPAGADLRTTLKRAALAALPKPGGWALRVFTLERTAEGERLAALLDRIARREMGGPGFAAALAATLDGGHAVLAVAARDTAPIDRMRAALGGPGR